MHCWLTLSLYVCVNFTQGCYVFIQCYLVKGCCEWIIIQPWTHVIGYSLPVLTWHTRLTTGISHLSVSGIVAHGRCYISHCFYFQLFFTFWFFVGWSLFLVFVFMFFRQYFEQSRIHTNLLTFLSDYSLNFIIFVMVLLHHIIVYYITKLH